MKNKILIIDKKFQSILFSFESTDIELAYEKMRELENLSVEAILKVPTVLETLGNSLLNSESSKFDFNESISEEIDHHDGIDSL
jgi:hypothetical protein